MASALEEDLPEVLGAYRVIRRLASGGTSDLLLARAEGPHGFEGVVVLKVLSRQLRDDARYGQMFVREAAAYARVSHPAIVRLYDFFADAGEVVLVLEYVDGLPLNRLLSLMQRAGARLSDASAMFVAWRVFCALGAAHGARDPMTGEFAPIIHRDVNPSNVVIPWDGHVKLTDFGMAKVSGVEGATSVGLMKGAYGYSAPEQVRGEPLTIRADVYSASLMLWELLAGRKAISRREGTEAELMQSMAKPVFPGLRQLRPDLPLSLLGALDVGLAPDPEQRIMLADEMGMILQSVVDLQLGRRELAEALAAVRPPSENEALTRTVALSPSAPPAATRESPGARGAPLAAFEPVPREPGRWRRAGVALGGAVALAALVAVTWSRAHPEHSPTVPSSARPAVRGPDSEWHVAAPPAGATPGDPTAAAALAERVASPGEPSRAAPSVALARLAHMGTLTVSARGGHRVWIDERLVGESPASFPVSCGTHTVRVGSQGAPRHVEVACSSEVVIR